MKLLATVALLVALSGHTNAVEETQSAALAPEKPKFSHVVVKLKNIADGPTVEKFFNRLGYWHQGSLQDFPTGAYKPRGVLNNFDIGRFKGFSGEFETEVINYIDHDWVSDYLEENKEGVYCAALEGRMHRPGVEVQKDAPWGLGRISHRKPDEKDAKDYLYRKKARGDGDLAYVVDTGVFAGHSEFEGRVEKGFAVRGGDGNTDANGHGTAVASIIGGKQKGVLKTVTIVPVNVGEPRPELDNLLVGLQWAVTDINKRDAKRKAVITFGVVLDSRILNDAVFGIREEGILAVVAAGNQESGELVAPASSTAALTVGALTETEMRLPTSNFGAGIDVFAPGANVDVAWIGGPDDWRRQDGTSLAAAYAAGVALYLIDLEAYTTPEAMMKNIVDLSTKDEIKELPEGTPNRILFNKGEKLHPKPGRMVKV